MSCIAEVQFDLTHMPMVPAFKVVCTLEAGHDGPHREGQVGWYDPTLIAFYDENGP